MKAWNPRGSHAFSHLWALLTYRRTSIRLISVYVISSARRALRLAVTNRTSVSARRPVLLPLDDFLRIAKALADARRFAILERIAGSDDAACRHLCEEFPVSQPTMSHHLRLLVDVGLVETRRDGQYVHYRLRAETVRAYVATLENRLNPEPSRRRTAARRTTRTG